MFYIFSFVIATIKILNSMGTNFFLPQFNIIMFTVNNGYTIWG